MGRKAKPRSIDEAIERLQAKAVAAASNAKPTGKASKQLLDITHHLTCLQLIKAMTDGESVAGHTFSAAQRYLQANSIKREPGMYDGEDDEQSESIQYDHGIPPGVELPYNDDGSPNEDFNILKD